MPQIVENWAEIEGVVRDVRPSPRGGALIEATVDVAVVRPVAGFPNFFEDAAGRVLHVQAPAALAQARGLHAGVRLAARIRRGASRSSAFVHPEHLTVSPGD